MRALLALVLLAPLSGCGLERALRDAAAWKAEAAKLQVERDRAIEVLKLCDSAHDDAVAARDQAASELFQCSLGTRDL